jgi:hypothetical protein
MQELAAEVSAGQVRFPVTGDIAGEHGNGTVEGDPPLYADIAALLDGGLPDPPAPKLLHRDDKIALFYAGQVNVLFGEPESAKTLIAQAAAAEAMADGRKVAMIDIDHNGVEATISRFLDMDVDEDVLRDPTRFRYAEPEDKAHLTRVIADLKTWRPAVAVLDSIGELLPLLRLSSNSPDDFTTAHADVLKPLAVAGAAVIAVDHLPKSAENKANGPTGTAAKRRAVGGVAIRVVVEEQFTPGQGGSAFLLLNKDRHGGLRRHCKVNPGKEPIAGIFRIAPKRDGIAWSISAPQHGDMPKTDRANPSDLAALAALNPPPASVRDARDRLKWNNARTMRAMREWRSPRYPGVSGKRVTGNGEVVSMFPTPVSGNGKRTCERCQQPADDLVHGRCRRCAYPGDYDKDDDDLT